MMPRSEFQSDGLSIAYLDEGAGEPILLIHGFASNIATNWVDTGWVDVLVSAGRRVVAIDNRGHGDSDKPHEQELYGARLMAGDASRLLEHLGISQADVMGYSMGARITAFLAIDHPQKVRSAIFGGLGYGMVEGVGDAEPIARALEAPSLDQITDPRGRAFRAFAEQTRSDLAALAACMRGGRVRIGPDDVRRIVCPALVVVGAADDIAGSPHRLAALMPDARAIEIPTRNHMQTVGDKRFKQAAAEFLESRP